MPLENVTQWIVSMVAFTAAAVPTWIVATRWMKRRRGHDVAARAGEAYGGILGLSVIWLWGPSQWLLRHYASNDSSVAAWFLAFGLMGFLHTGVVIAARLRPGLLRSVLGDRPDLSWDGAALMGAGLTSVAIHWSGSPFGQALAVIVVLASFRLMLRSLQLSTYREWAAILGRLSHELKTPVAAIRSLAETLHRDDVPDPVDQKRFLALILAEANRLEMGLERSLRLVRGGRLPAISKVRLDLAEWAGQVMERWRTLLTELTTEVSAPLPAEVDPQRLDEAIDALLDNALRHGAPPVTLKITASTDEVRIAVADGGAGVPDELRSSVARRMRGQVDALYEGRGRGLGVWAAGVVARAHGGRRDLETGSLFVLTLPQASGRGKAAVAEDPSRRSDERPDGPDAPAA